MGRGIFKIRQTHVRKSIIHHKIINGRLGYESKVIGLSLKQIPPLTHPTKYKILLSPQIRENQKDESSCHS